MCYCFIITLLCWSAGVFTSTIQTGLCLFTWLLHPELGGFKVWSKRSVPLVSYIVTQACTFPQPCNLTWGEPQISAQCQVQLTMKLAHSLTEKVQPASDVRTTESKQPECAGKRHRERCCCSRGISAPLRCKQYARSTLLSQCVALLHRHTVVLPWTRCQHLSFHLLKNEHGPDQTGCLASTLTIL